MTDLTVAEIEHLAKLARLQLSPEEQQKFAEELPKIVEFVDQLRDVKIEAALDDQAVVPLSQLRDDVVSGDRLMLGKLAPAWENLPAGGQVAVPPVFGDDPDA